MVKRLTQEDFIEKAKKLHGDKYTYENTVYVRSADKIEVTCPIHGGFYVTANNHISLSNLCGCPKCYGNKKISAAEFISASQAVHGGKYDYSKVEYVNSQIDVAIICPKHGEFVQSPTRHMAGRGCHACGGTKRQSIEQLIQRAKEAHDDLYDYSLIQKGTRASDSVVIGCPVHGPFTQRLKLHINREYGCPRCGQKSKREEEVAEFLSEFTAVELRNKSLLGGKEIDIWLPEFKVGIEFHGLYWHTYDKVGHLHRQKWELAEKANIRLIQIFSDEWEYKQNIVKNRLLAILGKGEVYNARQLAIKKVNMSEIRSMLEETHIQGAGVSSLNYALFKGDEVVAVATFGKSRTGAMTKSAVEGEWEVIRYASKGRVRGGFSKLFKQFKADVDPIKVISYCDLRYGNGKLYEATGFLLDSITEPDYWWATKNRKGRVPRYITQKHKMEKESHFLHPYYDSNKTEQEICRSAGMERIYGVGNQKWIWYK